MKINKCRDLGAIGFVFAVLGGVSVYVGCLRNAGLIVDDSVSKIQPNSGIMWIFWGIVSLVISAVLLFISVSAFLKTYGQSLNGIKKYIIGIVGVVLGIAGGILCFAGNKINNDVERQFSSVISSGSKDATGDLMLFGGIALVIIAVLLIIINIFQYYTNYKK